MELRKAERQRARIKMALQGPAGSGKTFSALLLAYGLCSQWDKVAVIDTENHSAELYSHLGDYNVVAVGAPFTPEKYIDAISLCEREGMQVIIVDSISHEWDGTGGILDLHSNMVGNSFTNWGKLTPRHNNFIQAILQSPAHIIGTIRSKQDYVLNDKNGKLVPEKVGMKGITRDGMDYEFTLVMDIDIKHNATASKDRTGLFVAKPEFKITPDAGLQILHWCNSGKQVTDPLLERINGCVRIHDLLALYNQQSPQTQRQYVSSFTQKRNQLKPDENKQISLQSKPSTNGHTNTTPS